MALTDALSGHRPRLADLPFDELDVSNPDCIGDVQGSIAELLASRWLARSPGIELAPDHPFQVGPWSVKRGPRGYLFSSAGEEHEYDLLFTCCSRPYIGEVKSLGLNGIATKLPSILRVGRAAFGDDVGVALFFPFYHSKQRDARQLQDAFPELVCIDLGYKRKNLHDAIARYYRSLLDEPTCAP